MLLDDVKLALRISNTAYDSEVADLIEGARMDLIQSGVSSKVAMETDNPDPLIKRAIVLYAKAHFGLDAPDSERYLESYILLKMHLSQAGDYRELV